MGAAAKLLANTLKKILSEPIEGFTVEVEDESNLFEWKIYIEGPKDTPYDAGVFQMSMKFPPDYPMSPPELKFDSDFWHPNVYRDTGVVCISILHPPGEDELSGELASERWLPTQTVTTIILSVISLLSAPNFSSPANVDASVEWRKNPEAFKKRCERLVQKSQKEKPTHIVIPHPDTNADERQRSIQKMKDLNKAMELDDDFMLEPDAAAASEEGSAGEEASELQEEEEDDEDGGGSGNESAGSAAEKNSKSKNGKKESSDKQGSSSSSKDKHNGTGGKSKNSKNSHHSKKHKGERRERFGRRKTSKDEEDNDGVSAGAGSEPTSATTSDHAGPGGEYSNKRKKGKKCIIM